MDLINSSVVVRAKLFLGEPFKRLAINLPLYWHLFARKEMRFGLSLSISRAVLLGLSWAAKLGCVAYCVQICLCVRGCAVIGHTMLAHPYRVTY